MYIKTFTIVTGNFNKIFLKANTITTKQFDNDIDQLSTSPTFFRSYKSASQASSSCHLNEIISDNIDNPKDSSQETQKRYIRNRKRKNRANPNNWMCNKRKHLRNSGQEYETKNNKRKKARSVKTPCNNCRFKCTSLITEEERKEIFDEYWNLGDLKLQRHYIYNRTESILVKYRYTTTVNGRGLNQAYYFFIQDRKVRVCKSFFLSTLDISDKVTRTVLRRKLKGDDNMEDYRGKHRKRSSY